MTSSRLSIIKAILAKTVSRGATVGEEASAVSMAVKLMRKYDIGRSAVAAVWPKGWDFDGRRSSTRPIVDDESIVDTILRKANEGNLREDILRRERERQDARNRNREKPKSTTGAPGSLGDYARQLLQRDLKGIGPYSYTWIIEAIVLRYPNAKTTIASLRWYENELRKQGKTVPKRKA